MNTLKSINNYIARQKGWIKANNLKKGDLVFVIKVHESNSKGWNNGWNRIMNRDINKVLSVIGIYNDGIKLKGNQEFNFVYPYTILRKIEVKKEGSTWEKDDIIFSKLQNNLYKIKKVNEKYLHGGIIPMLEVYNTANTVLYLDPVNCRFATKEEIINFYNN
jgi:hypothetical protein